jgi:hypothetical protein
LEEEEMSFFKRHDLSPSSQVVGGGNENGIIIVGMEWEMKRRKNK